MYCTKCGSELEESSNFCPSCGACTAKARNSVNIGDGWGEFALFLKSASLALAKTFLYLISCGTIFASGCASIGSALIGIYSFYCFGIGRILQIPNRIGIQIGVFQVDGILLILFAVTAMIVAAIFVGVVLAMIKMLKGFSECCESVYN